MRRETEADERTFHDLGQTSHRSLTMRTATTSGIPEEEEAGREQRLGDQRIRRPTGKHVPSDQ